MSRKKRRASECQTAELTDRFWGEVGGGRALPETKIRVLKKYSAIIQWQPGPGLQIIRPEFEVSGIALDYDCFVCSKEAKVRHHIIQLKNGGNNFKSNIVSLCRPCHAQIHPWLKVGTIKKESHRT